MSQATAAERNGNGTTDARQELVEALEAVLEPGQEVAVFQQSPGPVKPKPGPVRVIHLPPKKGSLAITRVRRVMELDALDANQPYVIYLDRVAEDAIEIAIRKNRQTMEAGDVRHWHCVAHNHNHGWAVVRVRTPQGWQPETPEDFPGEAEVQVNAHSIAKRRNKGVHIATVSHADWWIPIHRLK